MIGESYPFLSEAYVPENDQMSFVFLSQGIVVIPKLIVFDPIEKGGVKYYNWGFADLVLNPETGAYEPDDKVESNNGDIKNVFYTVVSTLTIFFERYPDATVHIEGSDPQRTEVYRKLIMRHRRQIDPFYTVEGFVNGQIEPFRDGIEFEFLLISRKKA
jgi:hypothetical protein